MSVAEESTRRSAFLSELSHVLSGLLDLRTGMQRLLAMVVPRLAQGATVALLDDGARVVRAASWRGGEDAAVHHTGDELPPPDLQRIREALEPGSSDRAARLQAHALRDGIALGIRFFMRGVVHE